MAATCFWPKLGTVNKSRDKDAYVLSQANIETYRSGRSSTCHQKTKIRKGKWLLFMSILMWFGKFESKRYCVKTTFKSVELLYFNFQTKMCRKYYIFSSLFNSIQEIIRNLYLDLYIFLLMNFTCLSFSPLLSINSIEG